MQKVKWILIHVLLGYVLPLCAAPQYLLDYRILTLILACIVLLQTQPPIDFGEAAAQKSTDKNSMLVLFVMSFVSIVAPVIEFAYFQAGQSSTLWYMAGLVLLAGGIAFRVWAIRTLGRHFANVVRTTDDHELIQSGPYKAVRHPSYLGAFLAFVGSAVLLEAKVSILIVIVAMLIAYRTRIAFEEVALADRFGETYHAYRQRTKAILPYIW